MRKYQRPIDVREVMSAILCTTGPVSTCTSVKSTKMSLHWLPSKQYIEAATNLENLGFGRLVAVDPKHTQVFIKKQPIEVEDALLANPDLGTVETYATRYHKPTAKAIGFQLRAKLVMKKLVSQKHFE